MIRLNRHADLLPTLILGGALAAAGGAIGSGLSLQVTPWDLGICLLWGAVIGLLSQLLFARGARHVAGAESALIVLLEFILGPIWVWLAFDEQASPATLMGGALVMLAVAGRAISRIRRA